MGSNDAWLHCMSLSFTGQLAAQWASQKQNTTVLLYSYFVTKMLNPPPPSSLCCCWIFQRAAAVDEIVFLCMKNVKEEKFSDQAVQSSRQDFLKPLKSAAAVFGSIENLQPPSPRCPQIKVSLWLISLYCMSANSNLTCVTFRHHLLLLQHFGRGSIRRIPCISHWQPKCKCWRLASITHWE